MNKVYLIIAESDLREDGYYILPGNTVKEEAKKTVEGIYKLLDYAIGHSSSYLYGNEDEVIKDIKQFRKDNPEYKILINQDLISMVYDHKNLDISWFISIRETVIQ